MLLYKYQRQDVKQIRKFGGRVLLSQEMGTGKSVISLAYVQKLPEARPIIVVCPATLKWHWQREAATHIGMRAEVLEGTKPGKRRLRLRDPMVIINYDILGPWLQYLKDLDPQILICDEAHFLVNRTAKRSKCFRELAKGVPHVLALSGTPLTNRPAELWNILNILRPDLYPTWFKYAHTHCAPRRAPWGMVYDGAENLDLLHNNLCNSMMIRRLKKDVLQHLPDKIRTVVPLDISNRREYNQALNDFIGWLSKQDPSKVRKAKRAERLVKHGYLKRLAARLKLDNALEWVDDFLAQNDGKIILFCIHKKVIEKFHDKYRGLSVVVDGSVTGKQRQLAIDKFLRSKQTRVLIGNIKAAGVGWSAKGVSAIAFLEIPWTPGAVTQAEDRCHGLERGQKGEPTSIFFLVAKDTIEEALLKIIQTKQQVANAILDGDGKGDNLDVFDLLEKELLKTKWEH